jgi:hypothetical protein
LCGALLTGLSMDSSMYITIAPFLKCTIEYMHSRSYVYVSYGCGYKGMII